METFNYPTTKADIIENLRIASRLLQGSRGLTYATAYDWEHNVRLVAKLLLITADLIKDWQTNNPQNKTHYGNNRHPRN